MSLHRHVIDLLARPDRFFEGQTLSVKRAATVVFVVALLSAGSLVATGAVLEGAVPGTATVENPDHRSGYECEKPSVYQEGDVWEDKEWTPPRGCTLPPTKEVDLGAHARGVLTGEAFLAFVAVVLAWPLLAGALYVLTPGGAENGRLGPLLAHVAPGFVPLGVLAVARPLVVWVSASSLAFPNHPDPLGAYVRDVALGFEWLPLAAASLAATIWSGVILVHALRRARDVSVRHAGIAVGVVIGGALLAGSVGPSGGARPGGLALAALVVMVVGFANVYAPKALIMFDMRFELIGMRNTRDVEPADWYVALHRIGGVLLAGFGFLLLGGFRYVV